MPPSRFDAEVHRDAAIATVALRGDIDREAESGLAGAYAATDGARLIVLDFTGVGYINSTGIALIVRLLADGRRDRREVRAYGLSPHYAEIFELTRLSDYMHIFADAAGAAAAPASPTSGGTA